MLTKSLTVVLVALAVTAHAVADPEITTAARGQAVQERQVKGGINPPSSVISSASSRLASVIGAGSSNSAQASSTGSATTDGGSASASGTSPGGIIASVTSAVGGAASSATGNSAITSRQVSRPLAFGAVTVVLSTLFGAAIVL